MAALVHLDTHVLVWLHAGQIARIPLRARRAIEASDLFACPMALLELEYLHEIKRLRPTAEFVFSDLAERIGLTLSPAPFATVIQHARTLRFTRDPFDRLIVAGALADDCPLITADLTLHSHVKRALWE